MLEAFRARGTAAVDGASGTGARLLWSAACDLVEAILLGVRSHLQDLRMDCELDLAPVASDTTGHAQAEVIALRVTLGAAPIIGEVATPSRFCYEVHLMRELRFALVQPPRDTNTQPLVLHVEGFELVQLSDMPALRRKIRAALGSELSPQSAYKWWLQNKDKEFPLVTSKFHRIMESLWGKPAMKMLPVYLVEEFLWAFLHGTNCHLQAFTFHHGQFDSRVRIAAQRGPGLDDEERELMIVSAPITKQALIVNRHIGERVCASTTNFGALLYGLDVGQPPASAHIITKVFTAARSWGPGTSGWQRHDPTWLCRDQKNGLGLIVREQGRIIWRLPGESDLSRLRPPEAPPQSRLACCRRRRSASCRGGEG